MCGGNLGHKGERTIIRKERGSRSLMNVTFRAKSNEMNAELIKTAGQNGIVSIGGHRAADGRLKAKVGIYYLMETF